jgi:hypothetical protein
LQGEAVKKNTIFNFISLHFHMRAGFKSFTSEVVCKMPDWQKKKYLQTTYEGGGKVVRDDRSLGLIQLETII